MRPPNRPDELDEFKRRVNLTEYAAAQGYQLDRRASSRNSATMRHPAGDKIIVAKGTDGHWVYFSVRDEADHGSVIDFAQRRRGGTLGDVRKELRRWTGGAPPADLARPPASAFVPDLEHIPRDLGAVRARFAETWPAKGRHHYLQVVRRLPAEVVAAPPFADRIHEDRHGNAIFPHYNRAGLCGYEIKGDGFTGFAAGGVKGLWLSRSDAAGIRRLVVAETAIDALSYAALHGRPGTHYASTGGEMNPDQPALLTAVVAKLPVGGELVLAVDHDAGGDKIAARITAAAAGRPDLVIVNDRPPGPWQPVNGPDWNDVLRGTAPRPLPRPDGYSVGK